MRDRFTNKVVLLVGGGTERDGHSNGSAAAVSYAREGATVVVVDRVAEAAEATVAEIVANGGHAFSALADVTSEADVERVVAETVESQGSIDVLHNNVGMTQMGLPPDLSLEDWNRAFSVNLGSVFLTCKYVLPVMIAQGAGAVVNISSLASLRYLEYPYPAYAASKAAVNHLTSSLALEYADRGIRINAVAPGYINSPMIYRQLATQYATVEEMIAARDAKMPNGKMGTPWDVANASLFLASDDASFINGVILPVDGGLHMRAR